MKFIVDLDVSEKCTLSEWNLALLIEIAISTSPIAYSEMVDDVGVMPVYPEEEEGE